MTAVVITAALFFCNITPLKNAAKDSLPCPRQYKQIHFVLGQMYIYNIYVCQYNFIQKFANFKTLLWKDIKDRDLSFGMVPTHILKAKTAKFQVLTPFGS